MWIWFLPGTRFPLRQPAGLRESSESSFKVEFVWLYQCKVVVCSKTKQQQQTQNSPKQSELHAWLKWREKDRCRGQSRQAGSLQWGYLVDGLPVQPYSFCGEGDFHWSFHCLFIPEAGSCVSKSPLLSLIASPHHRTVISLSLPYWGCCMKALLHPFFVKLHKEWWVFCRNVYKMKKSLGVHECVYLWEQKWCVVEIVRTEAVSFCTSFHW